MRTIEEIDQDLIRKIANNEFDEEYKALGIEKFNAEKSYKGPYSSSIRRTKEDVKKDKEIDKLERW